MDNFILLLILLYIIISTRVKYCTVTLFLLGSPIFTNFPFILLYLDFYTFDIPFNGKITSLSILSTQSGRFQFSKTL